jgi:hypothetical protein
MNDGLPGLRHAEGPATTQQLPCLRYARNDGRKLSSQLRVRIRIMKLSKLNSATCVHISESVR